MKAILVLDDISKEKIKSNVSVLISRGIFLVNSLSEITDTMLKETKTTFVMEGLLQQPDGFAELKFYKAVEGLQYVFLMQKNKWYRVISKLGRLYQTDIVNLNYDILQAASFDDRSLESVADESLIKDGVKTATEICSRDSEYGSEALALSNALLSTIAREGALVEDLSTYQLLAEQLQCENEVLRRKNAAYLAEYTKMFDKATQLNSVLSQYEVIFTKDIYTKIDLYSHSERPAIIYLKEYEWLAGFDKLIETLYNAIRIQSKKSVKVLRLFDSSSSRRLLTLPKYYKVIKNQYKMTDIESNNFICKTGDYARILDSLLLNRMHLDVLLIVDCKDHNDTVLSGSHIIFNVCGRKSSLAPLHLSDKNTITNEDSDLHWEDYDTSEMTKNESFIYLSSKPIVGIILQAVRQFEEVQ